MATPIKHSKLKWAVLYGVTGIVDLAQIIIDFTGVGIAVSEALELVMPFLLLGLLFLFKIPIFSKINRLLSILGVDVADALTGGIAPFWIADVWYIHNDIKKELAAAEQEDMEAALLQNSDFQALNQNGQRLPRDSSKESLSSGNNVRNPDTRPLNTNGLRAPSGRV